MCARTSKVALHYLTGRFEARKNPYDTFDRILGLERRYGATSTFFAVPQETAAMSECLQKLRASGSDIALHGINGILQTPSELLRQKRIIERCLGADIDGIRNHRLELMIPRVFEFQRHSGFKYDSSFFAPRYGGKRQYTPFYAVDGLLEIPLAFMDSDFSQMTLSGPDGVNEVWKRIERVMDEYRRNEGVCTILWHPHAFYDDGNEMHRLHYKAFQGFQKLYEMILQYGSENSDKMCSCIEVLKRWKAPAETMW